MWIQSEYNRQIWVFQGETEIEKMYNFGRLKSKNGAEGETRTPTREPSLDPEPSASTSSATSALLKRLI